MTRVRFRRCDAERARARVARFVFASALGCLVAPVARAQAPVSAFMQGQLGTRFDDAIYGLNTADRRMSTILLNADARWSRGESGFFVRVFSGEFLDADGVATGDRTLMYAEWTTRVSVWRAAGDSVRGIVRDLFVATQLNRAVGLRADHMGAGVKLRAGAVRSTNTLYYRRALGDGAGLKWRTSWFVPLESRRWSAWLEGSVDAVMPTANGTDIGVMPAALVDVGRHLRMPHGAFAVGGEWFIHRARGARLSAPQLVARWTF